MKTASLTRRRDFMAEINIIPLVDVVLVLLMIFMVTAPLLVRGIDMRLPKTQTNTLQPKKQVTLNIAKNHVIYLDQEAIPFPGLQARLSPLHGQAVYLRADQEVPYGEVMQVIDLMKQAGIDQIGLLTDIPADADRP